MSAQWQQLCDLIDSCGVDRGVHQSYPDREVQVSLVDALARRDVAESSSQHVNGNELASRLQALVTQSHTIDAIGKCPVVGITGLLNSGKSSLLASYLSLQGRQRVLRGTANDQGTHRFVLWLPDTWMQQADLMKIIHGYLQELFGYLPEPLADDPEQAFAQYNGAVLNRVNASADDAAIDPLRVPLVASDAGLVPLGLGLLDCPDIQTAFAIRSRASIDDSILDASEVQRQRTELLSKVGRLCSAFLVVSKLSSLHDATLLSILETLRDTMPGVRRILAVNKVKARYGPDVVDQQAQAIIQQFQIDQLFMAYDYRSHWAEDRVPPAPATMVMSADEKLPIFFRAREATESAAEKAQAKAGTVGDSSVVLRPPVVESYLHDLSRLLSPGSLVIETRRSVLDQLQRNTGDALRWFEINHAGRERQIHDAWQAIADACYAFMAERDASDDTISLRLQTSPAIVAQMSDSLVRSAPWSMRASLRIDRSVRQLQTSIVSSVKRVRWLQSISSSLSQFVQRFRHGETGKVVTADRFRAQLERSDRRGVFSQASVETMTAACERTLARFAQEDRTRLDDAWLDQWSQSLWANMPLKRKIYVGVMPLAPIFGPLLAVTMIPFDFGGSSVLVFASLKELALAAGISTLMLPPVSGQLENVVESETALSQLGELFAISCDSLGIPRPPSEQMPRVEVARVSRALPGSQLAIKPATATTIMPRWQLPPDYPARMAAAINKLRQEIESASAS